MLISGPKGKEVFKKVAGVRDHMKSYCLNNGSLRLSVEDLQ